MDEREERLADLNTIGAGVALEKFAVELEAVLRNIRDPNTEAKAKRRIVIAFTFLPNADREVVQTEISAKSILAGTRATSDTLWLGIQSGHPVATVVRSGEDPRQGTLKLETSKEGSGT
jgi:hypothetical protein